MRRRLLCVAVLACATPLLIAADAPEKPEPVTVKTAFGWIPEEHRFAVRDGRVEWSKMTIAAAEKAIANERKGHRVTYGPASWQVVRVTDEYVNLRASAEEKIGGVRYSLTIDARITADQAHGINDDQFRAKIEGEGVRVTFNHGDQWVSGSMWIADPMVQ